MSENKENVWKKLDQQIKALEGLERYAFTAFLAVSVATFNATGSILVIAGSSFSVLLFVVFCVLVIVKQRKIEKY